MIMAKKRGRPQGSSRKNESDYRILEQVADRIAREPSLKPTTAMKATGLTLESDLRRLREKWTMKSDDYLTAARSRIAQEREAEAQAFRSRLKEDAFQAAQSLQQLALAAHDRFQRWTRDNPKALEQLSTLGQRLSELHRNHQPTALEQLAKQPPSALEQAMRRIEADALNPPQLPLDRMKR